MKTALLLFAVIALTVRTSIYGQGFGPGYTFTYHFEPSEFQFMDSTMISETSLQVTDLNVFGTRLAYELFEGLPTGMPVYAGTFGGSPYVTAPFGTWGDLEGSFRITVREDQPGPPVNFSGVFVRVAVPTGGPNYDRYTLTVPVPEPNSLVLMSMGLAGVALLYRYSKRG